ncbi:uncharacterized protein LOC113472698 [Diaphorina citri]|uniref:Uncharacterized protein LOC113472698 n=1 Tax=Diaphorina citri TaxID=121845 RepID=A0A3Q0JMB1_DIACI|nr:uncharacterized protein LOC113472698 [Diaphorina citri]
MTNILINDIIQDIETKEFDNIDDWFGKELRNNNNKKDVIAIHVNVRSLNNLKLNMLQIYLKNFKKVDILVLTEISLTKEQMKFYELKNYNLFSYHRANKKGGGIAVYINKNIQSSEVKIMQFKNAENIEIELNKKKLIINAVYRPPKSNVKEFIKELKKWLQNKDVKNKDVMIIGDININILEETSQKQDYVEMLSSLGIISSIQKVTREEILNGRRVSSCIDHINIRKKGNFSAGVIKEKIADHYFTYIILKNTKTNDENQLINIRIIDEEKIKRLIEEYDWDELIKTNKNAEVLYNEIVQTFHNLYVNAYKEIKIKKKYEGNHWINQEIRNEIKKKQNLWKLVKSNPGNEYLLKQYKKARNKLTNEINKAKCRDNTRKFNSCKGDMKSTWKLINNITKKKISNVKSEIEKNFRKTGLNLKTITNNFNNSFKDEIIKLKSSKENLNTALNIQPERIEERELFEIEEMTHMDLRNIVKNIHERKAAGNDGIRPKDIKNNILSLQNILLTLFNKIITEGKIPTGMKISRISPVYKKQEKDEYSNYRPIVSHATQYRH